MTRDAHEAPPLAGDLTPQRDDRPDPRRAFEALCTSELRTPGRMATRIVTHHLAQAAKASARPIPPGERTPWSLPIRLTSAQRRELEARAHADGRTLSNLVTVLVVQALGQPD